MIVTITVSGPGGTINAEVEMIRQALVNQGYNVEVVNDYPDAPEIVQKMVDQRRGLVALRRAKENLYRIVADHVPWGG